MKLVIPTRPDLLVELQALMATDPDPGELAALIKKDVVSYSILLSIVNSPLFRRQEPIHSVEQAVAMLGTQRVATMLQTVALRTQMDPNNAWEKFWQMATEVATLSYQLA
ncbi:MAG: HDOD domain-containing protein, partial [Thalassolituus sp.]